MERKNPYHLSPLTNHKNTERGVVTGRFERRQYSERVEQAFEQAFTYERPLVETFRYAHTMQHGTPGERSALRVQAIQEQREVTQSVTLEPTTERHLKQEAIVPLVLTPKLLYQNNEQETKSISRNKLGHIKGPKL